MWVIKAMMAVCLGVFKLLSDADSALTLFAENICAPYSIGGRDIRSDDVPLRVAIQNTACRLRPKLTAGSSILLSYRQHQFVCDTEDASPHEKQFQLGRQKFEFFNAVASKVHGCYLLCQPCWFFVAFLHKRTFSSRTEALEFALKDANAMVGICLTLSHVSVAKSL